MHKGNKKILFFKIYFVYLAVKSILMLNNKKYITMPEKERKPGESIAQWRQRIINQNKYGDNGGELETSTVTEDRPDQKPTGNWFQRIRKFFHPYGTEEQAYNTFSNEEAALYRDTSDKLRLRDPDFAESVYNRLISFNPYQSRLANLGQRTDEYRRNYGSSVFPNLSIPITTSRGIVRVPLRGGSNSKPSDVFSIGWGWFSRKFGYQKKAKERDMDLPFTGRGTDIVDLSHDVIRPTRDSKQSTILFNEYLEDQNPSIYPAGEYQSGNVKTFGNNHIPVENVSLYNGIEDGHYKLDSLNHFDPNTKVFPARNIKRRMLPIRRIGLGQLDAYPTANRSYWNNFISSIDPNWYKKDEDTRKETMDYAADQANKIDSLIRRNNYAEAWNRLQLGAGPYTGHSWQKDWIRNTNNNIMAGAYPESNEKYYVPPYLLNIRARLRGLENDAYGRYNNSDVDTYYFEDINGNKNPLSDYDIQTTQKFWFGNPSGGFFVNALRDMSPAQVDSANAYLGRIPSYPTRADDGGFSKAELNNPSLWDYSHQYWYTNLEDPNYFTFGTLTPNRLWEAVPSNKQGGVISKLQNGKYVPHQFPDWKDGDKCPTGECAFFSNSQLRDYFGVPAYGNAWELNGEPLYTNSVPKPMSSSKNNYFKYLHDSADQFASDFDFNQLDPNELYQVNMYYNGSPNWQKAEPTGNGTHAGYLQFKDGQWQVVHNIHGTVHVDALNDVLGGNQKSYGILNVYRVPDYNRVDNYKQRLDEYVSKNPIGIWTEDSANVRDWLRKNSPETLQNYWNNLTDEQRKKVDRRFKP